MSAPILPPDAPFTPEELAKAEALRDALHAENTDSEDAALLHELRALHTDADLSEAEHEALMAKVLEQAGAGAAEPVKPVLRLLRRVSYAVVPTLAAAATVMFVIRGREAQAPASAAMSENAAALAPAPAPGLEQKASGVLGGLAAKREESEKVPPLATTGDRNAATAPLGKAVPSVEPAERSAEYAMPPRARIDDAVPGGGALGTGSASGTGAGGTTAHGYAEAPRARAGASAKGAADNGRGDHELRGEAFGAALGAPSDDRTASADKNAAVAKDAPAPTQAPAAQAAAPGPEAPAPRRAPRAVAEQSAESDSVQKPSAKPAAPAKPAVSPTCKARCTELLEARKRLDASCTQASTTSADAKVCADQRAWLTQQFAQHRQACGVCK